ncbi:MAG: type I 3-dehydroquinate dehydratase [Planctomycetota bacterium]
MRTRKVVQVLTSPDDLVDPRVDLLELRFDLHDGFDPARYELPCIATVRRKQDGGAWSGGPRQPLFDRARGAAYFDLEVDAEPITVPEGTRVLRSVHDLRGMRYDRDAMRGDLIKIVVTPPDAVRALELVGVGFGLGDAARFTRFLGPLVYCSRTPVVPGIPTPEELFDELGFERLSNRPGLFGVAGDPIEHSESPRIHNPALRRDGLDALYLRFPLSDLRPFWPRFVECGGLGLSITAPLKVQAAALARDPDADVRACGAANTLLADGRAANTDYRAFLELIPGARGRALVMGAGGSARAAVVALRELGYTVSVWSRRPEQAAALGTAVDTPRSADVIVNTTPRTHPEGRFVIDLRYGESRPPADIDGRAFLWAQARYQYRLFTGGDLD